MSRAVRRRIARSQIDLAAVSIDGGIGLAAVAAVAALPPGPQRELEARLWARRILARDVRFAFAVPEGAGAENTMQAAIEIDLAMRDEIDALTPGQRREIVARVLRRRAA